MKVFLQKSQLKSSNFSFFLIITAIYLAPAWGAEASLPAKASPLTGVQTGAAPNLSKISLDHIEESTVFFKAPEGVPTLAPLKTKIFDLSYLGQLTPNSGAPYFLMTGKPCADCMDDKTIYALRHTGGTPNSFVYPGKILDPKSRALLFESRAFFGKCLASKGDVYVVFQKERVDKKHALQSSVYIAEASSDALQENLLERRLPNLHTTLSFVKRKTCHEIPGRNRLMLSKPLDLNPRNHDDDNDGDDRDDDADPEKTATP